MCRLRILPSDSLHLSHPLGQFVFAKLEQVINTLFAEVHALDVRDVLRWCPADPARHDHRIHFQYDPVIDNLVNGEGDEIVIFYQSAFVRRVPAQQQSLTAPNDGRGN